MMLCIYEQFQFWTLLSDSSIVNFLLSDSSAFNFLLSDCQTSVSGYLMFWFLFSEMFHLKFQLLWHLCFSCIFNTMATDVLGINMPRKTVFILKLHLYIESLPMYSFHRGPLMWRKDCRGILYSWCLYLPIGFSFCHSKAMWVLAWPNHYWGPS